MDGSSENDGWIMPSEYERLIKLEQLILDAVDIARQTCEELALKTDHDNAKLLKLCSKFSDTIEFAQMLTLEGTRKHRHHPSDSGNVYPQLHQGRVFMAKIDSVKQILDKMKEHLEKAG